MPLHKNDVSKIRNKVVRGQEYAKLKKEARQAKLKKRLARKEAEARGETVEKGIPRTIENTREWLGEDDEYADARARPAPVTVDEQTGDVHVDMGTLSNLFPAAAPPQPGPSGRPVEPKMLITTSPGKPPALYTKQFLEDFQALLGGKSRADIVPRRSPKYELSKVARWARKRGYGAIAVVGEDHAKPTSLTVSLLPYGPTAHFRLSGVTLCKDIPGHAKATSHPPELVLNHFQTPLGLSLATLLSQMFLPPQTAAKLAGQGYVGRQVVLAQNSRDFVFLRRYRYMFALKSHRLGKTKKQSDVARMTDPNPEDEIDDTVKTRFQEIGPQMTLKMRWIRRGPLGETGDERMQREKYEAETGEVAGEFGEKQPGDGEDPEGDEGMEVDGEERDDEDEEADEEAARREIGLDAADAAGQPNFAPVPSTSADDPSASSSSASSSSAAAEAPAPSKKRPRSETRIRKKMPHPLYRPPPSPSPPPAGADSDPENDGFEAVPLPAVGKKKNPALASALSAVGKTWHAGKGEGGVREGAKRREWNWEAKMQVSRRKFFL